MSTTHIYTYTLHGRKQHSCTAAYKSTYIFIPLQLRMAQLKMKLKLTQSETAT